MPGQSTSLRRVLFLPLALTALFAPALGPADASGCARVKLNGAWATPEGLCVLQVTPVTLEGEPMVAALVALPKRPGRHGVFVYRRAGGGLEPRFLGSGFSSLEVDALRPSPHGLELDAHDAAGRLTLTCGFRGFPLECER